MERIPGKQPSPVSSQLSDMQGLDFPMYVYKPRRGVKRTEESKDTYKLPHRLIEKKRRDRINECIAQLKDLLPEHLKLTTLGHLEKAVVLELTLTHVKGLTSLLEQQQQKIFALQNGMQIDQPLVSQEKSEAMFRSGFHMCAKEVLQYLANQESQGDSSPSHVINHLHKVASEALEGPAPPRSPHAGDEEPPTRERHQAPGETPASPAPKPSEGHSGRNCVPVIQRVYAPAGGGSGEQSGSDTDTDSGYGGEPGLPGRHYGRDSQLKTKRPLGERWGPAGVKQEDGEPRHKRQRAESSEDESLSGGPSSSSSSSSSQSGYMSMSPQRAPPPLCLPFYLIPPSAAAYLPMLDKCWYPGSVPLLYPGLGDSAPGERPPRGSLSPRGGSPPAPHTPGDAPALLQVLRQGPPLGRCKD